MTTPKSSVKEKQEESCIKNFKVIYNIQTYLQSMPHNAKFLSMTLIMHCTINHQFVCCQPQSLHIFSCKFYDSIKAFGKVTEVEMHII